MTCFKDYTPINVILLQNVGVKNGFYSVNVMK